ncbi:MAG: Flp family type IVb pilin [Rhizobiales bacterium]|nr:Flp family type IVb pilin [Hyphomicrobiales bacterium]
MKNLMVRFMNDESGATAIEYGLIAAGISVVIISAVEGLGDTLDSTFVNIDGKIQAAQAE